MKFKTPHVTKSKNIGNSENLWSLNKLPLTEQFGEFDLNFPSFTMDFNIDTKTGHAFSGNVVSPSYLYTNNNYHYRGNISTKAKLTIDGFDLFCDKYSDYSQIKTVVDIGGNDLQWISSFKSRNIDKECYVIDPIKIEDDGKIIQGVNVIGKFIENVNLKEIKPDLIIFRHTMEHIENPSELIESLIEQVSEDTKIIIEVPDLSSMIESLRFECVFHQHLHYFNSDTLSNIIQHSGGSVLGSEIDPSGSCGGTLRIAFTKKKNKQNEIIEINVKERIKKLKNGIELFEKKMALTRETINFLPFKKYGYGAGLMLSSFSYHLNYDFNKLECIFDDDPNKNDISYKNVNVKVKNPDKYIPDPQAIFMITSLENVRPIFNRILSFNPRRIIIPLIS